MTPKPDNFMRGINEDKISLDYNRLPHENPRVKTKAIQQLAIDLNNQLQIILSVMSFNRARRNAL